MIRQSFMRSDISLMEPCAFGAVEDNTLKQ